jgi:hypothetical protein
MIGNGREWKTCQSERGGCDRHGLIAMCEGVPTHSIKWIIPELTVTIRQSSRSRRRTRDPRQYSLWSHRRRRSPSERIASIILSNYKLVRQLVWIQPLGKVNCFQLADTPRTLGHYNPSPVLCLRTRINLSPSITIPLTELQLVVAMVLVERLS